MTATVEPRKAPRRVFPFRMSENGIDTIKADADDAGVTPSEWIRQACAEKHARQAQQRPKPASDRATTRRRTPDADSRVHT